MAVEITSGPDFEGWLDDKPLKWAEAISARALRRALPIALDPSRFEPATLTGPLALRTLRGLVLAFAVIELPGKSDALRTASAARDAVPSTSTSIACEAAYFLARSAASGSDRLNAITAANASMGDAMSAIVEHAARSALSNDERTNAFQAATVYFWQVLSHDAETIRSDGNFHSDLWPETPEWWSDAWDDARKWLSASDQGFEIWREWYYGRIEGLPHAFADFTDAADEKFYRWIAQQGDDWWGREPAVVNADITEFVDALRKPKVKPPTEAELTQEPRALLFKGNDKQQVSLSDEPAGDKVADDEEAQDRHNLAREAAQKLLEASERGLTQASDIASLVQAYLTAIGEDPNTVKASNLVAFGAFLRDQKNKRAASSKPPFSEDQEEAIEQWEFVHNFFVAADPYLSALERLAKDPNTRAASLEPEAGKAIIEDGRAGKALDDSAADGLTAVADAVSAPTDPSDPQNQTWMDSIRNSIRTAAAIAKKHPFKTGAAVVGGAGAAGGGAYKVAEWVQRNHEALLKVFADEPSMLAIINWIASLLL